MIWRSRLTRRGNTPQLTALWTRLNDDPYMTAFLLIYVIGHLLSAVLIGYMLGRLRIIPSMGGVGLRPQ